MTNRNMRIGLGVLGIFAILVLCGTMLAAGFVIGRQTLDGGNNDALAGDRQAALAQSVL